MKTYLVGGAVRDRLMGLPVNDHDYVVTESSREELLRLGFLEVGKSHTVFLHPKTKEEYTLAQSLEDDLGRRDLTMNAIAMDGDNVIDYWGGAEDIASKRLRHISEINFYKDPLRVYRAARFAAQFPDFTIDGPTVDLMKSMVEKRMLKDVDGERFFIELRKALATPKPSRFFRTLEDIGVGLPRFNLLQVDSFSDPITRFASLFVQARMDEVQQFLKSLALPSSWEEAARITGQFYESCEGIGKSTPREVVDLFYSMDAYRKPNLIQLEASLLRKPELLLSLYQETRKVTSKDVDPMLTGKSLGQAIMMKRIEVVDEILSASSPSTRL